MYISTFASVQVNTQPSPSLNKDIITIIIVIIIVIIVIIITVHFSSTREDYCILIDPDMLNKSAH